MLLDTGTWTTESMWSVASLDTVGTGSNFAIIIVLLYSCDLSP